jgi:hypothetical protein
MRKGQFSANKYLKELQQVTATATATAAAATTTTTTTTTTTLETTLHAIKLQPSS